MNMIQHAFQGKLHYKMKSWIIKYKSTNDKTRELALCSKAGLYCINRTANEFHNWDGYKISYTLK